MSQAPLDQPGNVRDENHFDVELLRPFIAQHAPELADAPLALQQFAGGASNLTYQINAGDRALILRRPPAGTKPKSGHDMHREYRVQKALNPHFPCPRPLAYCADERLIGAPFYVMEKVSGVILRRDIPRDLSYDPPRARQLCTNLLDTLIRLHTIDYKAIGLSELGHPEGYVARQVSGWCERFQKSWTDDVPKCENLMTWLREHQPADDARPGIIHNDFRFDNAVLDPTDQLSVIAVLDWEMCTIGDPLMDLGGTLAYWVQADDPKQMQTLRMQPSHLPGMFSRDEIVRYYGDKTGRQLGNFDFYYVFGLFRLAVIAQQIYYRWKLGQTKNPRFQAFGLFVGALATVSEQIISKSKA